MDLEQLIAKRKRKLKNVKRKKDLSEGLCEFTAGISRLIVRVYKKILSYKLILNFELCNFHFYLAELPGQAGSQALSVQNSTEF